MSPEKTGCNGGASRLSDADQARISLTEQTAVDPAAAVTLDGQSPSEVWRDLLNTGETGLFDGIRSAVRQALANTHHSERAARLESLGVDAEDGILAAVLTDFALAPENQRHEQARRILRALGRPEPSPLGWRLDLDLASTVCAVFDVLETPPVVEVEIAPAFRDQSRDQRQTILELLVDLAAHVDIRITGSPIECRWLDITHRAELPASVTYDRNTGRSTTTIEETVAEARDELSYDGRAVGLLRDIVDTPSQTLTYGRLATMHSVDRSYIRRLVTEQLRPLSLVERIEQYGEAAVSLLPAGERLVEQIDADLGRQQTLSDSVTTSPNRSDNSRVDTRKDGGGDGGDQTATAAATTADRTSDRLGDFHTTAYLDRATHAAAASSVTDAEISLVDTPLDQLDDAGTRLWSYDDNRDELVVGAEYLNPMQWQVCIALACSDWRTFTHVLDDTRLEEILDAHPASVLRQGRNLGGLSEEAIEDVSRFRERLEEWRDDLIEMTSRWRAGDFEDADRFRGEITRVAHGLAGTMIHLCDLAGVEVVRLMRVPDFSRDFSANRDDDRRADLIGTVVTTLAIQSTYKHRVTYRQLYERRGDKRQQALGVEVDAEDPHGEVIGGLAIVGHGVDSLEEELLAAHRRDGVVSTGRLDIGHLPLHDDAPEFMIPVRIRSEASRAAYSQAIQRVLSRKNLRPTQEAVGLLRGLTGDIWAVTAACSRLSAEMSREIGLDEVRYALSTLSPERILPSQPPTVGRMIHALLGVERPLSRGELADRADISMQSIRNHLESLQALALVVETESGVRIAIPTTDERHEAESVVPFYVKDRPPVAAAIYELAGRQDGSLLERLSDFDGAGAALSWPPDFERLVRLIPRIELWVTILRGVCDAPVEEPALASLGPDPSQQAITDIGDGRECSV